MTENNAGVLDKLIDAAKSLPPWLLFPFLILIAVGYFTVQARPDLLEIVVGSGAVMMLFATVFAAFSTKREGETPVAVAPLQPEQSQPAQPQSAAVPVSPHSADARSNYLKIMSREWDRLRLSGIDKQAADFASKRNAMTLAQVYVALDTQTPRPEELHLPESEIGEFGNQPPLSVMEALCHSESGRIVLLGQPGSGKSTFARHICHELANALLDPQRDLPTQLPGWRGAALLPLFIPLGMFASSASADELEQPLEALSRFIDRLQIEKVGGQAGFGGRLLDEARERGAMVVFDGLDEVPGERRDLVKRAVDQFACLHDKCRVLLTCRTHSYRHDAGWHMPFPEHQIADLTPEQIEQFIGGWYQAMVLVDPGRGADFYTAKAEKLAGALRDPARSLSGLARNPLLLTIMTIIHGDLGELPDSRVEVYEEAIELLLLRWEGKRSDHEPETNLRDALRDQAGVSKERLMRALNRMAFDAHGEGAGGADGEESRAVVRRGTVLAAMERFLKAPGMEIFLAYCARSNGLLLEEGQLRLEDGSDDTAYAFPHLSFEEYLAARHLEEDVDRYAQRAAELAGNPAWREVVFFLGEMFCHGGRSNALRAARLLDALCPDETPQLDDGWRRCLLAGRLLLIARPADAIDREISSELDQRIITHLCELLQSTDALFDEPQQRAEAGRYLAQLGDPRPGVGCDENGLPDILWARIPGTDEAAELLGLADFDGYRMGSGSGLPDPEAVDGEKWPEDAAPIQLPSFRLAAHPVTVAQYRPFVEGDGYRNCDYWTQAGWDWREEAGCTEPLGWSDDYWNPDNHPVIGVSWFEAQAYCNWLNRRLGLVEGSIRLPSEPEWEWAARGPHGLRRPWGEEDVAGKRNGGLSIGRTSAVGGFPGGASCWQLPQGFPLESGAGASAVHEMIGNVWEWCADAPRDYSAQPGTAPEGPASGPERVLRGGGWYGHGRRLRSASRNANEPGYANLNIGFRLAGGVD